jgi:hypothetical protein
MGKKKNTPTGNTSLPAIRIGTRVRCTDDGVEGGIAWANAVSVKIKWDDGEEVTWKRAQLASKPIEFLDAEAEAPQILPMPEQAATSEAAPEPALAEESPVSTAPEGAADVPAEASVQTWQAALDAAQPTETAAVDPLNTKLSGGFAIKKRQRKPKTPAEPKVKKLSALDAAAKVLGETGTPMTCKELIGAMAAKGYWTSPGGRTPDATLAAAIIREIAVKGEQSRFVKPAPGRFALRPTV